MTQSTKITFDAIVEDLRAIIAEKGEDFVYEPVPVPGESGWADTTCVYFNPADNSPSCIVGHWVAKRGVPAEVVIDRGLNEWTNTGSLIQDLEHGGTLPHVTTVGTDLLASVQHLQDRGVPWGEALSRALDAFGGDAGMPQ